MFTTLRQMALLVGGPILILGGLTTPSQAAPLPVGPSNLRPAPTPLQNPAAYPAYRPGFVPGPMQPNWVAPVRPIPSIGSDPRTWTPWWLNNSGWTPMPYPPYPYPYPYPWYGQGSQLYPLQPIGPLNPYYPGSRPSPYLPGVGH